MTIWLEKPSESFDGCLMIFNIGEDNLNSITKDYKEYLKGLVAEAHANGECVLYAFDRETGPYKKPFEFSDVSGMSFMVMTKDVCDRSDVNFKLLPSQRQIEFENIKDHLSQHRHYKFCFGWKLKLCGLCQIDSIKTVLPVVQI